MAAEGGMREAEKLGGSGIEGGKNWLLEGWVVGDVGEEEKKSGK